MHEIRDLAPVSTATLCQAFNQAFSDYIVPLQLTVPLMEQKIQGEHIQLPLSIGAFKDGVLSGFILHGTDPAAPQLLYNGGTGVIPASRGQRLVQQMYGSFLPLYRQQGIQRVLLEVISTNQPAIRAYTATGFATTRLFHCYKGEVSINRQANSNIHIAAASNPDWRLLENFGDQQPSWSNTSASIKREGPHTRTWVASWQGQTAGYISVFMGNKRIRQIGVHRNLRGRGIGSALLQRAVEEAGNALSIINITDENTALQQFLLKAGMSKTVSQYEMALRL